MYTCCICSMQILTYRLLKRHINSHHYDHVGSVTCRQSGCMRTFKNIQVVYKHIKLKHQNNITKKKCVPTTSNLIKLDNFDEEESMTECDILKVKPENSLGLEAHQFNFMCRQYIKPHLSRKDVNDIINEVQYLSECYDNNGYSVGKLSQITTEFRRINIFKEMGIFVEPCTIPIGRLDENDPKVATMQYISLKDSLRCAMSNHNFRNMVDLYLSEKNVSLTDFKDGLSYAVKCENGALPFVIYFDDFESGNPLGSHKGVHKIGSIYCSLRCMEPHMYSSLQNIYLVTLFHSKHREKFGNKRVLAPLLKDLIDLERNGLIINKKCYKFVLAGILGDNLGLHSMLGMVESFSSNYYCRFCKASKKQSNTMTEEAPYLLRNVSNYNDDLDKNDPSATGLKNECIFNELESFHATSNFIVDVMHDICEGVANTDLCLIIKHYIHCKVFSLDYLNGRIQKFPFNSIFKSNKPPLVTERRLKSGNLGFNASEMHCLVLNFPLIIGDVIPRGCEVWSFFLLLLSIMNICSSKHVSKHACDSLDVLVKEHHQMFMLLFKQHLRPKFHFLIHYGRILRESGPLSHNWSFRFEAKHLLFKMYSPVCRSRVNILKSLALRHQLLMSSQIHLNPLQTDLKKSCGVVDNGSFQCRWIKKNGITLAVGNIIGISTSFDLPQFGEVVQIIVRDEQIRTKLNCYSTINYIEHLNSYKIVSNGLIKVFKMEHPRKPLISILREGNLYVSFNQYDVI